MGQWDHMIQVSHRKHKYIKCRELQLTFLSFFCGQIDKPHPIANDIYLMSSGCPLYYALAALTVYYRSDMELHKLLMQLVNRSAESVLTTEWG